MEGTSLRRSQADVTTSPQETKKASRLEDDLYSSHGQSGSDYQMLRRADMKVRETWETRFSGEMSGQESLGDWSQLYVDSQALLKQLGRFPSSDHPAMQSSLHDMQDRAQTHFFQSSDAIREALYTDKLFPVSDLERAEPYIQPFIEKYVKASSNNGGDYKNFYRNVQKVKAEQTNANQEKTVSINYYNPESRFFIAYSNSREEQAKLLKPLHEGETKKEIYQRTPTNSQDIHHVQQIAVDAHNRENPDRQVSLQDMPDLTIVRHSISNKEYKAVRPSLTEPKDYTKGDDTFQQFMKDVPNFKSINYLLEQHYPHLEVQKITILPNASADSALVYAAPKESPVAG
jgi:hypothetical protein